MSHSRAGSRTVDMPAQAAAGSWNKSKSWATENRPMSRHIGEPSPFFVPTYLKGSRYIKRLRSAHQECVAQWEEKSSRPAALSSSPSHSSLGKAASVHTNRTVALQDVVERLRPTSVDDQPRPLPERLSEDDRMNGLEILAEGAEVRFAGVTKTSDDAASVRADHPMPKECGLYYFEVTVLSRWKDGMIGVGISTQGASLSRLPGWENDSWAYHGDDGHSFGCKSAGNAYGPRFSSQDVIGCGFNFRTGSVFFTKNGVYLGVAFTGIKQEHLYPSVGMKKPSEHLRVNFGRTPFVFDIDRLMAQERHAVLMEISRTDASHLHEPDTEDTLIHKLVEQYLAHEGYVETGKMFARDLQNRKRVLDGAAESSDAVESEDDTHAIHRQKIRKAILDGDIDRALKYTFTFYPKVFADDSNRDIYFRLRCRKFIEMMRRYTELSTSKASTTTKSFDTRASSGRQRATSHQHDSSSLLDTQMELDEQLHRESLKEPSTSGTDDIDMDASTNLSASKSSFVLEGNLLNAALTYGQELQYEFGSDPQPHVKKQLQDLFAIIAYANPADSPIASLLDIQRRIQIAEDVNGAILVSLGKPSSAAIEKLCAQTELFLDSAAAKAGGAAAFVDVRNDFLQ